MIKLEYAKNKRKINENWDERVFFYITSCDTSEVMRGDSNI